MQIIGLTGSIASGKSTVREAFERSGVPTIDTDRIVHSLLAPGGAGMLPVAKAFPAAATKMGLDRSRLGDMVFADEKKLKQLEAILHPLVQKEVGKWVRMQRRLGFKKVAVEVPLLFEANMQRFYDITIVTVSSKFAITQRALKRPGMTKEKLTQILSRQWPQARKCAHADVVIYNGLGGPQAVE